jgi:uncharacterized protein YdeI (YjbR/CyaY-like superfamily)
MKKLYLDNSEDWRRWLSRSHDKETEIWLVFYKKGSGKPTIEYEQAVEEALCFGWIDSIIRKIDYVSYAYKFTPRKKNSFWSTSNKRRVKKLLDEGKMTDIGLAKIEAAKKSGWWDKNDRPNVSLDIPPEFEQALSKNIKAREYFDKLSPGYRKQYILWIAVAKRNETKQRRIEESIALLERGEKLGLK